MPKRRSESIAPDLIYHSHRELVSGVGVLYNIGQEILRTADIVPFPRGGTQEWWKRPKFTPHLNPPPRGADRGGYVMCGTSEPPPSPSMGEGSGGGEDSTSSPLSPPSPAKGEGVLTHP
jgi:hypothetical protein